MTPRPSIAWGIVIALIILAMRAIPKYSKFSDIQKAFLLGRSTMRIRAPRIEVDDTTLRFQVGRPMSRP